MKRDKTSYPPTVFNLFKPVNITSYDVIRILKRKLPRGCGKIGHFGTLDPFACGVLLVGIAGASRINNFIHDAFSKTYLAVGKLGVHTITGDLTVEPESIDTGKYLETIKSFSKEFIDERLNNEFLGSYYQSPHVFSAAKYEGKALHAWAREDVFIQKEKVERFIHSIKVVRFNYPWLSIRIEVSSGTYIRSLFSDMAKFLGTYGSLKALVRENIGPICLSNSTKCSIIKNFEEKINPSILGIPIDKVLILDKIHIDLEIARKYRNGNPFNLNYCRIEKSFSTNKKLKNYVWIYDNLGLIGLGQVSENFVSVVFNLPTIL